MKHDSFLFESIVKRVEMEKLRDGDLELSREGYIKFVDNRFKQITPKIADYKTSKTDSRINTIRHGFNILARTKEWQNLNVI